MISEVILKIWVYDRPGVLDRITGLIRRKSWNIHSMTVGDSEAGVSQLHILLKGRNVDAAVLGEHLDEIDAVCGWIECRPDQHVIREMAVLRIPKDTGELPDMEGLRIAGEKESLLFVEYTGTPWQVDALLQQMRGRMLSYVRSGPLVLADETPMEKEER